MEGGLQRIDRAPWHRVRLGLPADHKWFWCDLDGAHLTDHPPQERPLATHVWGWRAGSSWIRLRVDGDEAYGARLSEQVSDGDEVRVEAQTLSGWPADEGRVNPVWAEGSAPTGVMRALRTFPANLVFLEADP